MRALIELGSEYPIEQAIEVGLKEKDFYTCADECRYLLWSFEEYLAQKQGGESTIDENERTQIWSQRASDSIEHILPQNPSGTVWQEKLQGKPVELHVNRIGNLLLLPIKLNQEAQRLPFDSEKDEIQTKKKVYRKHHLRMIEEVCLNNDWTLSEIENREKEIIEWVKTRWDDV